MDTIGSRQSTDRLMHALIDSWQSIPHRAGCLVPKSSERLGARGEQSQKRLGSVSKAGGARGLGRGCWRGPSKLPASLFSFLPLCVLPWEVERPWARLPSDLFVG